VLWHQQVRFMREMVDDYAAAGERFMTAFSVNVIYEL